MTNQSGGSSHQYFYSPYGRLLDNNDKLLDSSAFTGSHNQYTLTGKPLDAESGLTTFGARYYDAANGSWLTRDPLPGSLPNVAGLTQVSPALGAAFFDAYSFTAVDTLSIRGSLADPLGRNRYLFNRANPLSFVDFTGGSSAYVVGTIPNHPWLNPPPSGGTQTQPGSNPPSGGGGDDGDNPDPESDPTPGWQPLYIPLPTPVPTPPASNGLLVFANDVLKIWVPRGTQQWANNVPGRSSNSDIWVSQIRPNVYKGLSIAIHASGLPKATDFLQSIGDYNRNPQWAASRDAYLQGIKAWGDIGSMQRETIRYTTNAIQQGNWADARRGAWGYAQEAGTLAKYEGVAVGQAIVGILTTPYRIVDSSIPNFARAVRERWEGKDRAGDVIFTATNLMGDVTALYGMIRLAGKALPVPKSEPVFMMGTEPTTKAIVPYDPEFAANQLASEVLRYNQSLAGRPTTLPVEKVYWAQNSIDYKFGANAGRFSNMPLNEVAPVIRENPAQFNPIMVFEKQPWMDYFPPGSRTLSSGEVVTGDWTTMQNGEIYTLNNRGYTIATMAEMENVPVGWALWDEIYNYSYQFTSSVQGKSIYLRPDGPWWDGGLSR